MVGPISSRRVATLAGSNQRDVGPRTSSSLLPSSSHRLAVTPALLDAAAAAKHLAQVRTRSERLAARVSAEDAQVQSMPDVSPTKWHLAHTTWFFETFLLRPYADGYEPFDADYHYLFNSYYEAEGPRHPRPERGLVSRPGLAEIIAYRAHVSEAMTTLIEQVSGRDDWPHIAALIDLGCHHEEQHQELLLTDIKHVLSCNPLKPAYAEPYPKAIESAPDLEWIGFDGGLCHVGHDGDGFAFDCEGPRHKAYLEPFELASRPVTNREYLEFIEDGGYRRADLWLSDAWALNNQDGWTAPLYWEQEDGDWFVFTLFGRQPINLDQPACHLSYYEADAFATWAGARLPTEAELEVAQTGSDPGPVNDLGTGRLHPTVAPHGTGRMHQLFGDVWEWTRSAFAPYPGFKPSAGAIGEYNGKFMCGQFVLKGGSCVTPPGHWRASYRNFFPPHSQWQVTGARLARD